MDNLQNRNSLGRFIKGHEFVGDKLKIGFNFKALGRELTEDHRGKISRANKGRKHSLEQNRLTSITTKKAMESIKIRKKISDSKKGKHPWNYIDGIHNGYQVKNWDEIRYQVYTRDKFTCQDCSINSKPLDVHHIIPFRDSKDNNLKNLVALCRKCHARRDAKIMKKRKRKEVKK